MSDRRGYSFPTIDQVDRGSQQATTHSHHSTVQELFHYSFYYVFMLSLLFLVIAENMRVHSGYGRLPPTKLKERVEGDRSHDIYHSLDLGVIIVRVAGIFGLSETPVLATGLVFISMVPWTVSLITLSITTLQTNGNPHTWGWCRNRIW